VQAIDPYARRYIEIEFTERTVVSEPEIRMQFLRLEDELFLQEINSQG
jgi:hypothetical protein